MEMDSKSLGRGEKRTVGDPIDFACVFTHADSTKDVCFPLSNLSGVFEPQSEGAKLGSRFVRDHMSTDGVGVSFLHVLFLRKPLKIIGTVISSVVILVMDNLRAVWTLQPAERDESMDKTIFPRLNVTIGTQFRREWKQLSKDFPAPRNGVFATEYSVFDSVVDVCAQHGKPSSGSYGYA